MRHAENLLQLLADGNVHSGTRLGEAIGVSRAAVWKHLQQLQDLGVSCHAVPGLGYQLEQALDLLDADELGRQWKIDLPAHQWHYFLQTDSTNSFLLKQALDGAHFLVCSAEFQTAGRGRRGRQWVSPFASNLAFSFKREFSGGIASLGGLSLAVGVIVAEVIDQQTALPVQLKWPNDLRVQQKKLGGILIELSGEAGGPCQVVIGVGLNVHMKDADIDQAWTSITQAGSVQAQGLRCRLLDGCVRALVHATDQFEAHGFAPFVSRFRQRDEFFGKQVIITGLNDAIEGVALGVDDKGALQIQTEQGIKSVLAGEVSLRMKEQTDTPTCY